MFTSQRPLILLLTVFGVFAYEFEPLRDGGWKLQLYCIAVNFLISIMFGMNAIEYVATYDEFLGDVSTVTFYCLLLECVAVQFNNLTIMYCIFIKKHQQIALLKVLKTTEDELANLPFTGEAIKEFHRRLRISSWFYISGTFVFFVFLEILFAYVLIMNKESVSHWVQVFIYSTITCTFMLYVVFLIHIVMTVGFLFDVINVNLEKFIERSDFYQNDIGQLMKLHFDLIILIENFNSVFGFSIIGMFIFLFTVTAFESFYIYVSIVRDLFGKAHQFIIYAIANMCWELPLFILMHILGISCSKVQDSIEETKKILRSIEGRQLPMTTVNKQLTNLLQLDTRFTANGFFFIDSSFVYNVSCGTFKQSCNKFLSPF